MVVAGVNGGGAGSDGGAVQNEHTSGAGLAGGFAMTLSTPRPAANYAIIIGAGGGGGEADGGTEAPGAAAILEFRGGAWPHRVRLYRAGAGRPRRGRLRRRDPGRQDAAARPMV